MSEEDSSSQGTTGRARTGKRSRASGRSCPAAVWTSEPSTTASRRSDERNVHGVRASEEDSSSQGTTGRERTEIRKGAGMPERVVCRWLG
jgi:hypothetical protein